MTYDVNDYLTRIEYPGGRSLEFTYDAAGRRASSVDQLGHRLDYHYDAVGPLESLTDETGSEIVHYSYDPAGRLARKDLGNGVYTTYQYDAAGQLLHLLNYAPDGSILSRFDYTYDSRGRRISMNTLDGNWTYEYDDIGQLTHAVLTSTNPDIPDQDLTYVYDAMGNRIRTIENGVTTEYTTNRLNQYTQVGDTTYVFDADGNLIQEIAPEGTTTYTHNDENRLLAVASPEGIWLYTYDAFGNRVTTTENNTTTHYVIDPIGLGNLVEEYDDFGNLLANYAYGFGLISRTDAAGSSAYYAFDAIGSTSTLTNATGAVIDSYVYDPFGRSLAKSDAAHNPFEFVGLYGVQTEANGLYLMRARTYDPQIGKFAAADPLGILGGDINLTAYVGNNPTMRTDITGMQPDEWFFGGGSDYNILGQRVNQNIRDNAKGEDPGSIWMKGFLNAQAQGYLGGMALAAGVGGAVAAAPLLNAMNFFFSVAGAAISDQPIPKLEGVAIDTIIGLLIRKPWADFILAVCPLGDNAVEWLQSVARTLVYSKDPNAKTGPAGFGPDGFVSSDSAVPYRIDFENEASATAPAQQVVITDQLDSDLDWSSFALTEIGFGDRLIAVPGNTQHFETIVPTSYNGVDFEVWIEAGINYATGVIYAVFQSLDPITSLPPDVLTGFLPPEDGTGRGMGHISYIINPNTDLATGTEIRNIALIVFDGQPAIATNQVDPHDPSKGTDPTKEALNTIDAGTPSSYVLPLPPTVAQAAFLVEWTGADDPGGSGIASYDIFVGTDGGL